MMRALSSSGNSSRTETIKETDILKKCYIKDEKTVTITADGSSVAGTILEVDDDGVTVDITQV